MFTPFESKNDFDNLTDQILEEALLDGADYVYLAHNIEEPVPPEKDSNVQYLNDSVIGLNFNEPLDSVNDQVNNDALIDDAISMEISREMPTSLKYSMTYEHNGCSIYKSNAVSSILNNLTKLKSTNIQTNTNRTSRVYQKALPSNDQEAIIFDKNEVITSPDILATIVINKLNKHVQLILFSINKIYRNNLLIEDTSFDEIANCTFDGNILDILNFENDRVLWHGKYVERLDKIHGSLVCPLNFNVLTASTTDNLTTKVDFNLNDIKDIAKYFRKLINLKLEI